MVKNKRILFLCQNTVEANAWYRSSGIVKDLQKQSDYDIDVINWQSIKIDWAIIMRYDVILLQRPFTREALSLAGYIKECGVKLWVDYDDNLLEMNPEHKNYMFYNKQETKANIVGILNIADAVSVTTSYLKDAYSDYSDKIHVIPNAFNESIKRGELKKREKTVFWRGSDSHIYNLWHYGAAINKAISEFDDWRFDFMGFYPWMLSDKKGFIEGTDIVLYFRTIFNLAPSVFHAPLVSDNFNMCRSNISFIEGSFTGAVSIAPSFWKEDHDIPAIFYDDQKGYYEALRACCSGEVDIVKHNKLQWEYVKDNLSLNKINKLRIKLLKNL